MYTIVGLRVNVPEFTLREKHLSKMCTAFESSFMERDGPIRSKFRKRGGLKMQQLSWADNMTRIMPFAARKGKRKPIELEEVRKYL